LRESGSSSRFAHGGHDVFPEPLSIHGVGHDHQAGAALTIELAVAAEAGAVRATVVARILEKPNPLLSGQVSATLALWVLGLFKDSMSEAR